MEYRNNLSGFLLVEKPTGITSFKCIVRLKKFLPKKIKIGHSGTLDSFATGLLIIALDRTATRYISNLMSLDKVYIAQGKLGQLTDTLDFTGKLIEKRDGYIVNKQDLLNTIASFGKNYVQIPPIYSALKYKGWALSELLRKQKMSKSKLQQIAQKKSRKVELYSLKLVDFSDTHYFTIKAHVSHGTYIRVLINDIAKKVNTVATTHTLHRISVGPFSIERAVKLHDIKSLDDIKSHLLSVEQILSCIIY